MLRPRSWSQEGGRGIVWGRCRQRRQDIPPRVLDGKGFSDFDKRTDGRERGKKCLSRGLRSWRRLGQRLVACADDGDSTLAYLCATCIIQFRSQYLPRLHNVWFSQLNSFKKNPSPGWEGSLRENWWSVASTKVLRLGQKECCLCRRRWWYLGLQFSQDWRCGDVASE